MSLVRILVDGYSLIHGWPPLAGGYPPFSEQARDTLVQKMQQFVDSAGTPVTIFFDGAQTKSGAGELSTRSVEVLFSKKGQTADSLIERAAFRFKTYGDVLVVTDDRAEREVVHAMGALTQSCDSFGREVDGSVNAVRSKVEKRNQKENKRFRNPVFE